MCLIFESVCLCVKERQIQKRLPEYKATGCKPKSLSIGEGHSSDQSSNVILQCYLAYTTLHLHCICSAAFAAAEGDRLTLKRPKPAEDESHRFVILEQPLNVLGVVLPPWSVLPCLYCSPEQTRNKEKKIYSLRKRVFQVFTLTCKPT